MIERVLKTLGIMTGIVGSILAMFVFVLNFKAAGAILMGIILFAVTFTVIYAELKDSETPYVTPLVRSGNMVNIAPPSDCMDQAFTTKVDAFPEPNEYLAQQRRYGQYIISEKPVKKTKRKKRSK